jgi:hypothetical protein
MPELHADLFLHAFQILQPVKIAHPNNPGAFHGRDMDSYGDKVPGHL